jgi:hypothetical protein
MSVVALQDQRHALTLQLSGMEGMLRGSLQRQFRRCGKAGCRCADGEPHGPYIYLAVRTTGRRGMVYVPAEAVQKVEKRLEVTSRIEAVLEEISAINIELLSRGELD